MINKNDKDLSKLLVVAGLLGLLSAVVLTIEKVHLLESPGMQLSCDLNPIVACGSVIATDQASAFGFPNPLLGIAGFSIVLTIGMAMLAGAKFKSWFWKGLQLGVIFGVLFVHWLIYQSLYVIGALCPYCMVVWAVTIPLFIYVTKYNLSSKHIKTYVSSPKVPLNSTELLVLWYAAIISLIMIKFWYYWQTVAPFSWLV